MHFVKKLAALTVAALLSVPMTAMAATGTSINSVSLRVVSDITVGESGCDVTVTTTSGKYSIYDTEMSNEPDDEWGAGDKPKVKVTLEAEDDYYFPSGFAKSSVSVSGADGTVSSVSRSGSSKLIVNINLSALEDENSNYDLGRG